MANESSVSVGVSSIQGKPDRVAIVVNGIQANLSAGLARKIAVQMIMTADFLDGVDERKVNDDT